MKLLVFFILFTQHSFASKTASARCNLAMSKLFNHNIMLDIEHLDANSKYKKISRLFLNVLTNSIGEDYRYIIKDIILKTENSSMNDIENETHSDLIHAVFFRDYPILKTLYYTKFIADSKHRLAKKKRTYLYRKVYKFLTIRKSSAREYKEEIYYTNKLLWNLIHILPKNEFEKIANDLVVLKYSQENNVNTIRYDILINFLDLAYHSSEEKFLSLAIDSVKYNELSSKDNVVKATLSTIYLLSLVYYFVGDKSHYID